MECEKGEKKTHGERASTSISATAYKGISDITSTIGLDWINWMISLHRKEKIDI